MLFTTLSFFFFFSVVLFFYWVTPGKYRWGILLAASFYFYFCWEPLYTIVLVISILIDYYCGLRIGKSKNPGERLHFLILSLFSNLGLLFIFKYLDFFNTSLNALLQPFNISYNVPEFNIVVPLGLSYYTFRKLSYMIDVYRENLAPEKHLGKFALYVSFFPAIIAGPIDRAKDLLPQFSRTHGFNYSRITGGLKLVVWGMFKKLVIADHLATFVQEVYNQPRDFQGLDLIIATLFFSIQVYADFSGYSDMAIGIAQIMGYNLTDNFNRPYFATSITEFWRRWHISLTTWLRDYLFLPAAYAISRRIKKDHFLKITAESWSYIIGISVTMLICGLWHGARWTFIIWGGLHGLYLALSFSTRKYRKKWRKKVYHPLPPSLKFIYKGLQILFTFFAVSFLWIFFRANTLADAFYIIAHITGGIGTSTVAPKLGLEFVISLAAIGLMLYVYLVQPQNGYRDMFAQRSLVFRWVMYLVLVLAIMNLGKFEEIPFIYVQF
ncbi:MAG: hypothetical protein QG657_2407 [Acidobacteriota bacterium]|nr:hypothetical protein [Acidobacteriota bacterium]